MCLYCFKCFCGTKNDGHAYDHFVSCRHRLVLSLVRKSYWCFCCRCSSVHPTEDSRVQIAFGMCMTSSVDDRISIGHLLRRFYRQGKPHPTGWDDLPAHRRSLFGGSREDVTLDRLLTMWQDGVIGNRVVVMVGAGISVNAGIYLVLCSQGFQTLHICICFLRFRGTLCSEGPARSTNSFMRIYTT